MDVKKAYKIWAEQYDSNINKTRDLEGIALKENLNQIDFKTCLEIGCGTGKNTEFLISKADEILAIDISEEMISKAKEKINSEKVKFHLADINENWNFTKEKYELICFSLVLEHIENLEHIFEQASNCCAQNGNLYIGELHPYKQYSGTKARFETDEGLQIVKCFNHNISDFTNAAKKYNFEIINLNEYFDNDNKNSIPRILTILFKKK